MTLVLDPGILHKASAVGLVVGKQPTRIFIIAVVIRLTNLRAAVAILCLTVLLVTLSACGEETSPQGSPQGPAPTLASPSVPQDSASIPTPDTQVSSPSPTTTIPASSPSDQSNSLEAVAKAPGFSLMSGLGEHVTLDELLEDHEAVVVVFYRGFF